MWDDLGRNLSTDAEGSMPFCIHMAVNLPCICWNASNLFASLLISACADSSGLLGAWDKPSQVEATVAGLKTLYVLSCAGFDPTDTARPKY